MIDQNKIVDTITLEIITKHIVAASNVTVSIAIHAAKAHLKNNSRTCVGVRKQAAQVLNALEELGYIIIKRS